MPDQRGPRSKARAKQLPEWAEEIPERRRKPCVGNHTGRRCPLGRYRIYQNSQGQTLETPEDYCGEHLNVIERNRERHDERVDATAERRRKAENLKGVLRYFAESTGVSLEDFATLGGDRLTVPTERIRALADALVAAYDDPQDLPGDRRSVLREVEPTPPEPVAKVIQFARRVPVG